MSKEDLGYEHLDLDAVIGFDGKVTGGLLVHPDRQHIIYPLGCLLIVEEVNSKEQRFLHGHSDNVSCVTVSKSGKYIASGQVTHMGFVADIIVWDYASLEEIARFKLHKVKVRALAFSPNDKYLVSLGGQDDGCVVVWSLAKKEAICGSPAQVKSAGITECLTYSNHDDNLFVTAGDNTLRVWELDLENRKIRPTDVTTGQTKRVIMCVQISQDDSTFYCGTTTGDILGINMHSRLFQFIGPEKDKFSLGITALSLVPTGEMIVGAGDGTLVVVKQVVTPPSKGKKPTVKFVKTSKMQKLDSAVTSIALRGNGHQLYVGTSGCHIYRVTFDSFEHELINTCHVNPINDVVFPLLISKHGNEIYHSGSSDIFATCGHPDIRVWHTPTQKELLRVTIPNMTCYSLDILRDGSAIISGWEDSKIRGFFPQSGKLMFTIDNAHKNGVTAIAATTDCERIVSGGGEGQVRVWSMRMMSDGRYDRTGRDKKRIVTELVEAMKEHTNSVSCIRISHDDKQCVSSSADGTCIIWDLTNFKRKQIFFANTLFRCVCFRPDECQILTSGTDRKIGYWELYDGSMVRELEGSRSGDVNGMDISLCGNYFVTAGDDKIVKFWKYDEGQITHVGIGHSTSIKRIRICCNSNKIVSVGEDGAIYIWRFPC